MCGISRKERILQARPVEETDAESRFRCETGGCEGLRRALEEERCVLKGGKRQKRDGLRRQPAVSLNMSISHGNAHAAGRADGLRIGRNELGLARNL